MNRLVLMFLVVVGSLFSVLACGGGGGGSTPSPAPGAGGVNPTTYSVSGRIASGSNVGLQGVAVAIMGQASSTTTTDSSGNYTFANLTAGTYTLTPALAGYNFSPTSGSFSLTSASATGLNFTSIVTTYPSTTLITDYMTTLHSQTITQFLANESALSSSLSSQGLYFSGSHYTQSKADYEAGIQYFLNTSLTYIQSTSHTMLIDKTAIIAALNTQKGNDKAYAVTYYSGVNWQGSQAAVTSITSGISTDLDTMYSLIISQIQIL